MNTSTSPANQPDHRDLPTTEDLCRAVAAFTRREDVEEAGYVFAAEHASVGDEAVVYSRGRYRAGIITKIGRVNATVTYTTATAIQEARDPHYGWTEPARTNKADKFAEVAVRPRRTAPANPPAHGDADRPGESGSEAVTTGRDAPGCPRPAVTVAELGDGDLFSLDGGLTWHVAAVVLFGTVSVYTSERRDDEAPTIRVNAGRDQRVLRLEPAPGAPATAGSRAPIRVSPFTPPDLIEVAGPDQECPLWQWEEPRGRHALLLGDPDDGGIGYCGTLSELTEFAARMQDALEAAGRLERPEAAPSQVYTVLGVWDGDKPVPVGVVAGEHKVAGGAEQHWEQGLWATSVAAADPEDAERAAVAEMRTDT